MPHPHPWRRVDSPDVRARFLRGLRASMTVRAAASAAGVSRPTVHVWRRADPAFAAAWDDAYALGTDRIQLELRRRAIGPCQPVDYRGRTPKHRRRPVDEMLIRLHALYETSAEAGFVDDGRAGADIPAAPQRVRGRAVWPKLRRRDAAREAEDAELRPRFLACLRQGMSVVRAAATLGVRPLRCNRWRWRDAEFAVQWEEAYAAGGAALVRARRKLAAAPAPQPVPTRHGLTPVTEWTDALLMFQLERRRARAGGFMVGQRSGEASPHPLPVILRARRRP